MPYSVRWALLRTTKFSVSSVEGGIEWPRNQTTTCSSTLPVFAPENRSVDADRMTADQRMGGSQ